MWTPFTTNRIRQAIFVERPNRFLVFCDIPDIGRVPAHLPSSGRLREVLLPGARLYLEDHGANAPRTTRFTVLAALRLGRPVFLHTHRTNDVARCLLEHNAVPGLGEAKILRAEAAIGHSRFDFLLHRRDHNTYLEVKSVTLFAHRAAMFPDAPTERGRKHLLELAQIAERTNQRTHVLFIVHHPDVDWFLPDYHTDPAFAQTMLAVRDRVQFHAIAVAWTPKITLEPNALPLRIPWDHIVTESADAGAYLLILRLPAPRILPVGSLGEIPFRAGWYIYVGSAVRGLTARIARHLRRRKTIHWHIDYLRQAADTCRALPIRSSRRDECPLAQNLGRIFQPGPIGFGSSDCTCPTHLFYSATDPEALPLFQETLLQFRLRQPI